MPKNDLIGAAYAFAAFLSWGILPLYWKLLQPVSPLEIISYRIFVGFVVVSLVLAIRGQGRQVLQTLTHARSRNALLLSAIFITINWLLYIWAVNNNHIVESSLGYYMNPLVSVLLGVLVLRERLTFWQWAAVGLAALGVLILTSRLGGVPWIALTLACSFGLYGLCKKLASVDALIALDIETLFVAPFCLGYILWQHSHGRGALGQISPVITGALLLSGVITVLPLWWFALAVKNIPLSRVGFIQYITPSLFLMIGVLRYKEPFTSTHLVSFSCIWGALLLYSLSQTRFLRRFTLPATRSE